MFDKMSSRQSNMSLASNDDQQPSVRPRQQSVSQPPVPLPRVRSLRGSPAPLSPNLPDGGRPQVSPTSSDLMAQMTLVLNKLVDKTCHKSTPAPPIFRQGSGKTLEEFFNEFERFAIDELGEDCSLWTNKLAQYLAPPLNKLCSEMVDTGATYRVVRQCLLGCYGENISHKQRSDYLRDFQQVKYDPAQGIQGLIFRLRSLAYKAYEGVDRAMVDDIVKEQCLMVLPEKMRGYLALKQFENKNMNLDDFTHLGMGIQQALALPVFETGAGTSEVGAVALVAPETRALSSAERKAPKPAERQKCAFCKKPGHDSSSCCYKNKLCFKCRLSGHFAKDCPEQNASASRDSSCSFQRRPSQDIKSPQHSITPSSCGAASVSAGSSGRNPPQACPFCGEIGHFMASCEQFGEYMSSLVQRMLN